MSALCPSVSPILFCGSTIVVCTIPINYCIALGQLLYVDFFFSYKSRYIKIVLIIYEFACTDIVTSNKLIGQRKLVLIILNIEESKCFISRLFLEICNLRYRVQKTFRDMLSVHLFKYLLNITYLRLFHSKLYQLCCLCVIPI